MVLAPLLDEVKGFTDIHLFGAKISSLQSTFSGVKFQKQLLLVYRLGSS